MQRNVDEIPRQYKQAENNNFPEVPLKGGNSNNGLRTGSRFPPGLFTIRPNRELRYLPSVPAITSARPDFETHANIRTPTFSSPREPRGDVNRQISFSYAHSCSSNGRGKIRDTEMHNGNEDGKKVGKYSSRFEEKN